MTGSKSMGIKEYLKERAALVDNALQKVFAEDQSAEAKMREAMSHSVMAGGKRLRPILCLESASFFDADEAAIMPAACALELIHNYSLIHDDLPCMDDSDFRHGKPSCHAVFGKANAVLAGDALLTKAFELLASAGADGQIPDRCRIRAIHEVAVACGAGGLVGGQVLDLEYEGKEVGLAEVEDIHRKKTAALLTASVKTGAILAAAGEAEVERLGKYGYSIGRAFQIADDILDEVGDSKEMGKPVGADQHKATYPAQIGLEPSREKAREFIQQAHTALEPFGDKARRLHDLADFIVERTV